MYIHVFLHSETRTSHTKYQIQERSAEGRIEHIVYGLVVENNDEQGIERIRINP